MIRWQAALQSTSRRMTFTFTSVSGGAGIPILVSESCFARGYGISQCANSADAYFDRIAGD